MKIDRTIKQTYDYDKFHKIKGNRDVNSTQVKQLIKSIEEGWVPNPAHVNEKNGLVDGQHRLEACRQLKIPFLYFVIHGAGINEVTRINRYRRNWGFTEWMNRYADTGHFEYKAYKSFFEKWGFDHWSTIFLLCKTKGYSGRKQLREIFMNGDLKLSTIEQGKKRAKMILQIGEYYPNYKRRALVQAMIRVFNDHRFNFRTFIHRLSLNRDAMYDCTTVGQYLHRIDAIYNKGALKKDRVKFAQRWEDEDPIFSEEAA